MAVSAVGDLDGDIGGLNGGDREHSWLQAEFVRSLAAEQRHEPVRPRLDLYLSHHRVADNTAAQAAEPVPHRMSHHHPAVPMIGRLGQLLRKPGERPPSTATRPEASVIASIRPPSAQRRKVSVLTPRRLAASLIRKVGILGL